MSCETNICRLISCAPTDDLPSYVGQYNLQSGVTYENLLISVPAPGGGSYYVPPGTIVINLPLGATSVTYQGCRSTVSEPIPTGSTAAQIQAIVNGVMTQIAGQLATCNAPTDPHGPISYSYYNNSFNSDVACADGGLTFSGSLPRWISIDPTGRFFIGAAGVFPGATQAEADLAAKTAMSSFVSSHVNGKGINCSLTIGCGATVSGTLTTDSDVDPTELPDIYYCDNYVVAITAGAVINLLAKSDDFYPDIEIIDPAGTLVVAAGDSVVDYTALMTGNYTFRLTTGDVEAVGNYTLGYDCGACSITPSSLGNMFFGVPYSDQLYNNGEIVSGWEIISGSLPDGLTLSDSGLISGTPTESYFESNDTLEIGRPCGTISYTLNYTIPGLFPFNHLTWGTAVKGFPTGTVSQSPSPGDGGNVFSLSGTDSNPGGVNTLTADLIHSGGYKTIEDKTFNLKGTFTGDPFPQHATVRVSNGTEILSHQFVNDGEENESFTLPAGLYFVLEVTVDVTTYPSGSLDAEINFVS